MVEREREFEGEHTREQVPASPLDAERVFAAENGSGGDNSGANDGGSGTRSPDRRPWQSSWVAKVGIAGLLAAVLYLATWGSRAPKPPDETVYPNWNSHVQVQQEVDNETAGIEGSLSLAKYVSTGGATAFVREILFGQKDCDTRTTRQLADALSKGDRDQARHVLKAAQQIPVPSDPEVGELVRDPVLTPGMEALLTQGAADMCHIYLYDSCDEDGDVVDIVLDNATFATVPITHKGATLSIPIPKGSSATVGLRGVRDGGGGITVACRTSDGDYFMRVMAVGEYQSLKVGLRAD